MKVWSASPAAELEQVFGYVARTRMAGLPICNAVLRVEAIAFCRAADGHWVGAMVTPWALNLLRLPGDAANWPELAAGDKHDWRFPSGDYQFIVADEARLGIYHLCSLFSPALEFDSHAAARQTAEAAMHALFANPIAVAAGPAKSRRAFLGLPA